MGSYFQTDTFVPPCPATFSVFPLSPALPPSHCGSNQTSSLVLCSMDVLILAENRKGADSGCLSCKGLALKQSNSSEPSLFEVVTVSPSSPRPHKFPWARVREERARDARRPAHSPTFRELHPEDPQRTGRHRCNCTCASVPSHQKAKTASAHQQLNGFTKCGPSAQWNIIWP